MNRLVTVELLAPAWTKSKAAREEFDREARSAARLAHPNLVTILDANEAGGRLYLVLEYVDGATLDAVVRASGPLPVGRACEFARQAALGLAHAHEKGLAHGNLSPASLLVGRPGGTGPAGRPVVKVLNVGLNRLALYAAATGDLHAAAAAAEYFAPEQLARPDAADPKADLYALGCTLYFLLTGRPPRPAEAPADGPLLHQFGSAVPVEEVRPDVPEGVAAVVRRLMHPSPAGRPATAAEAAGWLAAYADGEGNSSNGEFALPPTTCGAMTGFLSVPPVDREASPFAGLADDDLAMPAPAAGEPPAGATAGLLALAAAIIAVTGVAVGVVLRSVAR
jgi:serine/threonine-protein kinase